MNYRRSRAKGGCFFFTVVTHQRNRLFSVEENINLLREAFKIVQAKYFFTIDAFVLLPEHLHCIWTLPENDNDFSNRWRLVKLYFSRRCKKEFNLPVSASRQQKKEQGIWQRRFWEHQIRNDRDFSEHVDYIHYNPVKHGLVSAVKDWKYSTFHRYVAKRVCPVNWGGIKEPASNIGHE